MFCFSPGGQRFPSCVFMASASARSAAAWLWLGVLYGLLFVCVITHYIVLYCIAVCLFVSRAGQRYPCCVGMASASACSTAARFVVWRPVRFVYLYLYLLVLACVRESNCIVMCFLGQGSGVHVALTWPPQVLVPQPRVLWSGVLFGCMCVRIFVSVGVLSCILLYCCVLFRLSSSPGFHCFCSDLGICFMLVSVACGMGSLA